MLKKRLIFIFLTLFLIDANANTTVGLLSKKMVEDQEKGKPDSFFVSGILTIEDIETPFKIYTEKNKYFSDFSIYLEDSLIMSKTEEYRDLFQENNNKISSSYKLLSSFIPLDILNYPLRNRDYTLLEKSIVYKYKNLKANKILIQDKVIEEPEPIIDDLTSIENEPTSTEDEIVNPKLVNELEQETTKVETNIVEIEKSKFEINKYKKITYTIAEGSDIILNKEFYLNVDDLKPLYIYDVDSIKYIDGFYIPTEWSLTDFNTKQKISFKYNTETIIYSKEKISNEFEKMTNFYGVRE